MKFHKFSLLIILLNFYGCVEEFDLTEPDAVPRIVAYGMVNNKPGPYYIRVIKSKPGNALIINETSFYRTDQAEPITDATVVITDDKGQCDTLKYTLLDTSIDVFGGKYGRSYYNHGFYATQKLKGIPGRTYFLEIIWQGKKYEASSYMSPVPAIDSIGYLLKKSEIIGKSDTYFPLLYFAEPQGIKNYYLIQLQNEISAQSGYASSVWQFSVLSDAHLKPYVNGLNLSTGASPRGDSFYPIYKEGDSIYVALSSLSEQGYRYYKNLLDQFENDGGAYKPTPASPPTNISNGGLGLFRASAISEKRTKIPEGNR